jgi:transcriptional regulator with XRE-family HTH domain
VLARALACCDLPVLLEEVRKAHGWTQADLAGVVGYSQSWVSKVLRGKHALTLEQARNLPVRAGIPIHLLRLGEASREDPAKRRDFTKAAALALVPWPVLPLQDQDTASALRAVTARTGGWMRPRPPGTWPGASLRMWRWPAGCSAKITGPGWRRR